MSRNTMSIAACAGMALVFTAAAVAAPPTGARTPPLGPNARALFASTGQVAPADGGWSDTFDSYAAGAGLTGQGGWLPWTCPPPPGPDGVVSTAFAASAPNSFRANATTDMVQPFTGATTGQWVFTVRTYVPAGATGNASVILMNTYCPPSNSGWSAVFELNADTGQAKTWTGQFLPLLPGQWVEYRAEIDLTTDTFAEYYGGTLVASGLSWSGNVLAGGAQAIVALDLYSATINGVFFDDASLQPDGGCYPDCNGSGTLTVADFGCFQGKYVLGDLYADCNASGTLSVADFGCFQGKYVLGCP
ncbi:MAG: hypothetical protein ACKVU4_08360 [Phycisphaerales bacterium]